jgi:hypothetical protein
MVAPRNPVSQSLSPADKWPNPFLQGSQHRLHWKKVLQGLPGGPWPQPGIGSRAAFRRVTIDANEGKQQGERGPGLERWVHKQRALLSRSN